MAFEFQINDFAAQDLSTCSAGCVVWLATQREQQLAPMLILDSGDPSTMLTIDLEGGYSFKLRKGRMPRAGEEAVILLDTAPMNIELPDRPLTCDDREMIGAIAVNIDGSFIIVKGKDGHGFESALYVSMRDWTILEDLPQIKSTIFPVWRFTSSLHGPSEKHVIYAHGEW